MTLKTATLIALCGTGMNLLWVLADQLSHSSSPVYVIRTTLSNGSLLIFLFTLYRKQT